MDAKNIPITIAVPVSPLEMETLVSPDPKGASAYSSANSSANSSNRHSSEFSVTFSWTDNCLTNPKAAVNNNVYLSLLMIFLTVPLSIAFGGFLSAIASYDKMNDSKWPLPVMWLIVLASGGVLGIMVMLQPWCTWRLINVIVFAVVAGVSFIVVLAGVVITEGVTSEHER
jgi:hypothetical protein